MPWSPVIRPLTFQIRVKRWLHTTSPGPPNKLGSPPRSSTLLAPIVTEWGYSPAARRAASSICAVPKTRRIAAIVAVSFAGSVTVGCDGHLISTASGVSGRWTSSTTSRSDLVTAPTARNRSECLDAELGAGPELATSLVFHRSERFVPRCRQNHKISRNCARPRRQLPSLAAARFRHPRLNAIVLVLPRPRGTRWAAQRR
jgi:hypothetical protein